ncbi:hypothetical protein SRABI05_00846 [Agrobacterium fabrum]|nr:hypothetical protein SRABI05_00846 [Agrobacterium fabrum]CAH0296886.1 hypothetical protein SRABI46_04508 [Agrobacterium fabrum]
MFSQMAHPLSLIPVLVTGIQPTRVGAAERLFSAQGLGLDAPISIIVSHPANAMRSLKSPLLRPDNQKDRAAILMLQFRALGHQSRIRPWFRQLRQGKTGGQQAIENA